MATEFEESYLPFFAALEPVIGTRRELDLETMPELPGLQIKFRYGKTATEKIVVAESDKVRLEYKYKRGKKIKVLKLDLKLARDFIPVASYDDIAEKYLNGPTEGDNSALLGLSEKIAGFESEALGLDATTRAQYSDNYETRNLWQGYRHFGSPKDAGKDETAGREKFLLAFEAGASRVSFDFGGAEPDLYSARELSKIVIEHTGEYSRKAQE